MISVYKAVQGATDGIWQRKLLFVATVKEVLAVFAAADKERTCPFVEVSNLFASCNAIHMASETALSDLLATFPLQNEKLFLLSVSTTATSS